MPIQSPGGGGSVPTIYPSGSDSQLVVPVAVHPSGTAETYLTVRLTNGSGFYTAGGTTVSGGGVLTADQGSPNTLGNAWTVKVTDGSDVLGTPADPFIIRAASGSVSEILVGGAYVANANPVPVSDAGSTLSVDDGGGALTVDGTVTSNQGTAAGLGAPWTVMLVSGSDTVGTPTKPIHVTGSVAQLLGGAAISNSNPVPISDAGGALTVDGTVSISGTPSVSVSGTPDVRTVSGSVTEVLVGGAYVANANPIPVSDAGGALTVDGTVTIQDGGNVISVDDGGSTLSVDGTVTSNQGTAAGLSGPWTVMLVSGSDTVGHPSKGVHSTSADRTGLLYQDNTQRSVSYAQLAPSGSGNSQVVAAQGTGNKVRVLSVHVMVSGSVSVKFQSATTDITGLYPCRDGGGFVLPYNPHGWFQTAANEALNVNLSSANPTGVTVTYIVVT